MATFKDCLKQEQGPAVRFKKRRIEELRNSTPPDSVLLFQDEKGPIAAKTYGGSSWSSVQARVARDQKTKGLLNVFGVYDHTNDRMFTHCYRRKTSSQFVDFINRVDSLYDSSVKQIFLVLDNASIHRSRKTREAFSKHPRIVPVFLPTKAPELNLIEVRWMWMQRRAINNSTFENEADIGRAVAGWTENYNTTHGKAITQNLQDELIYAFT